MKVVNTNIDAANGYNRTISSSNSDSVNISSLASPMATSFVAISVIRYNDDAFFNSEEPQIGSGVVSFSVQGIESGQALAQPLLLTLNVKKPSDPAMVYRCGYYDFSTLSWRFDGCSLSNVVNTSTNDTASVTCSCTHLTNFAVLLDHQNSASALSQTDAEALTWITLLGCSISIFLMGVTVIVFLVYPVRNGIIMLD
jgi:hypothetical protein